MPAAVALHVPDSPIFLSPRMIKPSIFCKPCLSPTPPRKVLSLTSKSPVCSPPSSSPKYPLAVLEKVNSDTALLKRKRPARIDIPAMAGGVWKGVGGLATPKLPENMEIEGDCFSVYCKRGKKGCMEDRFSASVNFNGDFKQGFFGIYDGHGGANAAEFASKKLEKNVLNEVLNNKCGVEMGIRNGYLTTDKEFLDQPSVSGGACCVAAMIYKGELVVSNAGDCRAVICRGGVAEALTSDHQPSRVDERDRIQSLGGYVDCYRGVWRIQGSLAVTRGIGDRHLKEFVIAEPETKILRITPDCEFLILASDGLWDKVTNQEAVDLIRPLCIGVDKPKPFAACKKLVEFALRRCSMDDISVMIIQLDRFIS